MSVSFLPLLIEKQPSLLLHKTQNSRETCGIQVDKAIEILQVRGMNRNAFLKELDAQLNEFPKNSLCKKLEQGTFQIRDYHAYLVAVFHQVYHGPGTFGIAGAMCKPEHQQIRDYLLKHVGEEYTHWTWIIDDLKATGYSGPDPKSTFPSPATAAYIAFNYYVAIRYPYARLGIAAFLEGMSGVLGSQYLAHVVKCIGLKPEQATFMKSHSVLDQGHAADIHELLEHSDLSPEEWAWVTHATKVGGTLFTRMLDTTAE